MSVPAATSQEDGNTMTREELLIAYCQMQRENEWLRSKLAQTSLTATDPSTTTSSSTEAHYRHMLEVKQATEMRQHEELLELRQRCAFYAAAIEETAANHADMLQLFEQLRNAAGSISKV